MYAAFTRSLTSVALLLAFAAAGAAAHDYVLGRVKVSDAWTRATPAGATTAVGYLKISNLGPAPMRLTGATTTAAERVEIHEMAIENGVMRMRPMQGVDIVPGATVELKPGGAHLMLIGLRKPLAAGEMIPLTLSFAGGTTLAIELHVEAMGASQSAHEH